MAVTRLICRPTRPRSPVEIHYFIDHEEWGNMHDEGWKLGVHRAPIGAPDRWMVVLVSGTIGFFTREEARLAWADLKECWPLEVVD